MTTHTPLEILLLFQSLHAWGTESVTFDRISEALRKHDFINESPTYDPARLSSDALKQVYEQRLLEEEEAVGEVREDAGNPSPAKKRKLQSPDLASTDHQVYGQAEKLRRIVDQSYEWYSKSMVREIREDERKYISLKSEIQAIEAEIMSMEEGEEGTPRDAEAEPQSSAPVQQAERMVDDPPGANQTKDIQRQLPGPSPLLRSPSTKSDGFAITDLINDPTPPSLNSSLHSRDTPDHTKNGSHASPNAYSYPSAGRLPSPIQTASQGLGGSQNYSWPSQPSPSTLQFQPAGLAFSPQFPPPFSPSQPTPRASFSGPSGFSSYQPIPSSPLSASGHNIQLPPISSLSTRSSASPARSLDALADLAGQQTHMPSFSHTQPAKPSGYGAQNVNHDIRPHSGHGQPAFNPPQLPPINTFPPPLYPSQQSPPVYGVPARPIVANVDEKANTRCNSPCKASPNEVASAIRPILRDITSSRLTPSRPSADSSLPRAPTPRNLPTNSTGKGTRWKELDTLSQEHTPRATGFLESPVPEPLSPASASTKTSGAPKSSVGSRMTAVPKGKKKVANPEPSERLTRARAASVASSIVPNSTRSESEISHADELSVNEGAVLGRERKRRPSPQGSVDEGAESERTARPPSRNKGKRKRVDSPDAPPPPPPPPPPRKPGPTTHVFWTRNFSKICASALESFAGHKNASTFAAPVKDRDAPQYSSVIKYPQDLKSIRAAIQHGNRAAAAAASAVGLDPGPSKVKLPISDDIVPPRGIVNTQQLEKELAHMFANAVMYNPSPDGFVPWFKEKVAARDGPRIGAVPDRDNYAVEEFAVFRETKAMARDVDAVLEQLKAAERPDEGWEERLGIRGGSVGRGASLSRAVSLSREPSVASGEAEADGDGEGTPTQGATKRRRRA